MMYVKENVVRGAPVSSWCVAGALAVAALALAAVSRIDYALPEPLTRDSAPADAFIAENAYQHLLNLTAIGPRVAGSYENEVLAVRVLVAAVKDIARAASPHNRIELDVATASGAFPLAFLDGMNNIYQSVSMVVVRVAGVGGRPRPAAGARASAHGGPALLLNCHYDTVPDSPGASDDGAGCAVLLETLRAMAAARRPLRRDVIFLFNGAEENIMQASHGFITQHKWAKSVRVFINIEACGAGGREVLFQAGPHDPWILEVYAGAAPHPFASSVAQELFQSGLVPADTDFRIFRDFGRLSGLDMAWSANGYVYHTRLDTARHVPPAVLQRTGDNVLALAHGLVSSARLETEAENSDAQPVYFDVVGLCVVVVRARAALAAALAALAVVALQQHVAARQAQRELYMGYWAWMRAVARAAGCVVASTVAGVGAAVGVALAVRGAGAPLSYYSRPYLLAPLYAFPAVAGAWTALRWIWRDRAPVRGQWSVRALQGGVCCAWGAALAACVCVRARSGFVPLAWCAPLAMADLWGGGSKSRARCAWVVAALPALVHTSYLSLGALRMFVPLAGRAGSPPLPADALLAALVALLVLAGCAWILPFARAAPNLRCLIGALACACAVTCVLVTCTRLGDPYSPDAPMRLMVLHTRRTIHPAPTAASIVEDFYWIPALDDNTPHSLDVYAEEMASAKAVSDEECRRWVYCGMPYFLPVASLVRRSYRAPLLNATPPPPPEMLARLDVARLNSTVHLLTVHLQGPAHTVVIVSPVAGCRVSWSSAVAAPVAARGGWGSEGRHVYMFTLHRARPQPLPFKLTVHLQHEFAHPPAHWAQVSVAGHAQAGAGVDAGAGADAGASLEALRTRMPPWVALTGWPVDLHLYTV